MTLGYLDFVSFDWLYLPFLNSFILLSSQPLHSPGSLSVSQAESHLFTFTKYLLKNFSVLPSPFSTPLVKNKCSLTLYFSPHWLSGGYCKCSHGFNFHLHMWILHLAQISPEHQIAFHASSPASSPGHQVRWLLSECQAPRSARQGCSSLGIFSLQAWHPTQTP